MDLENNSSCEERESMGHCGTTNKGDTLYSLRKYDKNTNSIESFVTMAISPPKTIPHEYDIYKTKQKEGIWYQAKGKKNSKPKAEYIPYIVDILIEKNVFTYESEYNSQNDFQVSDFKKYLENHPDKYPNNDEILSKLEEQGLDIKAKKIWDEYDFVNVNVDYDIDGDPEYEYINAYGGFNIEINSKTMPDLLYIKNIIDTPQEKELLELIRDTLDKMRIYPETDWGSGEPINVKEENGILILHIYVTFRSRDENDYGDELSQFRNFLNEMSQYDEQIGRDDFKPAFIDMFTEVLEKEGLVDLDKPRPRVENPAQMKFGFAESVKFKQFFNQLIST